MGKPALIVQDFQGRLNEGGNETVDKLLKTGNWKKQRIVYILPAGDMMSTKVALAHMNMIFPPNQGVVRVLAQNMEVGDAYTAAIESIVSHPVLSEWEYILTAEHDNAMPQDGVLMLLEAMEANPHLACIGGLYFTKGPGGVAQIWGDKRDPVMNFRPQPPDLAGRVVECWGTGMGFNLWRMSMFKDPKLKKPWFKTMANNAGVSTQDLHFWNAAQQLGYRCGIHCGVKVGHFDSAADIMW